jgi:protein-disulfide isomerase
MIQISRRSLLASVALSALPLASAWADAAPDLTKLAEAPAYGERPEGSETAKVTIIEYASASCPHCAHFYQTVYPDLKKDYIDTGKVRFLFREFPHNDAALGAFMIAHCAAPEKYPALLNVFFNTQEKWVPNPYAGLKEIALQAGFTADTFDACTKNEKVAKEILEERKRAEGFGVTGIPYIFVNGKHYEGENTMAGLKAVIDPLLG